MLDGMRAQRSSLSAFLSTPSLTCTPCNPITAAQLNLIRFRYSFLSERMERLEELFVQNPNLHRLIRPHPEELIGLSESIPLLRAKFELHPEDPDVTFDLATILISHARASFIEEGVRMMQSLVYASWEEGWAKVVEGQTGPYAAKRWTTHLSRGVPVFSATAPPPDGDSSEDGNTVVSGSEAEGTSNDAVTRSGPQLQRSPARGSNPTKPPATDRASRARERTEAVTAVGDVTSPTGRVDDMALYHYYLTLGWIKLKAFDKAASCVEQMLLLCPHNSQGMALKSYIEAAERMETAVDVAKIAGLTAAFAGAAAVLGMLFRKK